MLFSQKEDNKGTNSESSSIIFLDESSSENEIDDEIMEGNFRQTNNSTLNIVPPFSKPNIHGNTSKNKMEEFSQERLLEPEEL